jgi:hypothetical protein
MAATVRPRPDYVLGLQARKHSSFGGFGLSSRNVNVVAVETHVTHPALYRLLNIRIRVLGISVAWMGGDLFEEARLVHWPSISLGHEKGRRTGRPLRECYGLPSCDFKHSFANWQNYA